MFTNISSTVIFISRMEMHFHGRYKLYSEAVIGGRWKDIENAKSRMFRQLSQELMSLMRIQFIVSVVIYLLAVIFLPEYGYGGLVMRIYPCLAPGYFTASFCLTTFLVSIIATQLPDIWYGVGVVVGSLVGWCLGYFRLRWLERHLDTHIFCVGHILKHGKGPKPSSKVYVREDVKTDNLTEQQSERRGVAV